LPTTLYQRGFDMRFVGRIHNSCLVISNIISLSLGYFGHRRKLLFRYEVCRMNLSCQLVYTSLHESTRFWGFDMRFVGRIHNSCLVISNIISLSLGYFGHRRKLLFRYEVCRRNFFLPTKLYQRGFDLSCQLRFHPLLRHCKFM
jgi:hypothetical protein